jgi:hypothetical protein
VQPRKASKRGSAAPMHCDMRLGQLIAWGGGLHPCCGEGVERTEMKQGIEPGARDDPMWRGGGEEVLPATEAVSFPVVRLACA